MIVVAVRDGHLADPRGAGAHPRDGRAFDVVPEAGLEQQEAA